MPRQKRKQAAPAESGDTHKTAKLEHGVRNPGMELDMEWVRNARVNSAAVLARAGTHEKRRSVKKSFQAGWLLRGMTCIGARAGAPHKAPLRSPRRSGSFRPGPLRPSQQYTPDLTTLAGDDTEERVRRLCGKARQPLRAEITDKLGITDQNLTTCADCASLLALASVLAPHLSCIVTLPLPLSPSAAAQCASTRAW